MADELDELIELLQQSGARVTLDPERNRTATCIGCGNAGPNELIHVGQYVTGTQGGMRPRDAGSARRRGFVDASPPPLIRSLCLALLPGRHRRIDATSISARYARLRTRTHSRDHASAR
jgi:hypothetical protein